METTTAVASTVTATPQRQVGTLAGLRGKQLTDEQIELLKRTFCKGATADELAMFLHVCNHTGLDPFLHQIHAVKRRAQDDDGNWREAISIQVGIDGLRLVAERTGNYAPGREPVFEYDEDSGELVKATSFVLKYHPASSTWHEVPGVAFYGEYVQAKPVWEGRGAQRKKVGEEPTRMWKEKPHVMLGKCSEAAALRKAFPNETSGLYIDEEMPAAGSTRQRREIAKPEATEPAAEGPKQIAPPVIDEKNRRELFRSGREAGHKDEDIRQYLMKRYDVASSKKLPAQHYEHALERMRNIKDLFVDEVANDPLTPHLTFKDGVIVADETDEFPGEE